MMDSITNTKQHQSSNKKSVRKSLEVENSSQFKKLNDEQKKSSYHSDLGENIDKDNYGIFTDHDKTKSDNDDINDNNDNSTQDELGYEYDAQLELLHNYGPGASSLQGLEDKGYQRIFTPAGTGRIPMAFIRNNTTSGLSTSGTIQTSSRRKSLSTNNNNGKSNGMSMLSVLQGSNSDYLSATSKICISHDAEESNLENKNWEYPGWGTVYEKKFETHELPVKPKKHQLDVFRSTAIAGNDLLASVLYTTGLVCLACGQLAPFSMLLCCLALFPFRKIFQECGTALPLNGGVYVAMLNSTTKLTATIAASCSLISYSATAVVSAASCTSYAAGEFGQFEVLPVTVTILGAFGFLVFFGVKDSANLALAIFLFHLLTLVILIIASFVTIIQNEGEIWKYNWSQPLPPSTGGVGMNLYLGFSVALLGLTGFETSANYIEEAGPFEIENNYKYFGSNNNESNSNRSDRSSSIGNKNDVDETSNRNNNLIADDVVASSSRNISQSSKVNTSDSVTSFSRNTNNIRSSKQVITNNSSVTITDNSQRLKSRKESNGSIRSISSSSNRSINNQQSEVKYGTRPISVFERTIDNMWWLVILINPAIALSTLGVLKLDVIVANVPNILSFVGEQAGGSWLRTLVSIDAIMVLSAGVLTAYVGVVGLIKQLASDRCLPIFLLQIHSYTNTNHYIIFSFFMLCSILYLMTNGDVVILSGVFSVAFLMVLISFATANLLLKIRRPRLPRGAHSSWTGTVLGFIFMSLGLIGNVIFNIYLLVYFIIYFVFYYFIIVCTFQRIKFTKQLLFLVKLSPTLDRYFSPSIYRALIEMRKHTVIFFTKTSELHILNKAILYAHDNCLCDRLIIIHVIVPDIVNVSTIDVVVNDEVNEQKTVAQQHQELQRNLQVQQQLQHDENITSISPNSKPSNQHQHHHQLNIITHHNGSSDGDYCYTPSKFPDRLSNNNQLTPSLVNSDPNNPNSNSANISRIDHHNASTSYPASNAISTKTNTNNNDNADNNNNNSSSTIIPKSKSQLKLNFFSSFTPSSSSSIATINQLRENLKVLDHVYPKVKIDLLLVTAPEFNPSLVAKLSEDLNIRPSFMFIRCPCENFKYNIGEFEGVRTIMK